MVSIENWWTHGLGAGEQSGWPADDHVQRPSVLQYIDNLIKKDHGFLGKRPISAVLT